MVELSKIIYMNTSNYYLWKVIYAISSVCWLALSIFGINTVFDSDPVPFLFFIYISTLIATLGFLCSLLPLFNQKFSTTVTKFASIVVLGTSIFVPAIFFGLVKLD